MKKCRIELDSGYRLSSVSVNGVQVHSYTFDANGNRTLADGQVAAFAADDRLMQYNGTQYSYDGNGALASVVSPSGTAQFRYDTRGNLLQVQTADGKKISYRIDARDRRVGKSVDGVPTEGFLYQDQLEPIAWLDGQGNIRATFVYGDRAHVPAYMEMAGKRYRYVVDHLGSVRQVVDAATGAVVQEIDYDVWGAETRNTNPAFQPFGFAGGITDRHTGLVRFGARDYDPATGRWTSKDPVRFSGGWNLYGYCDGDPVNFVDVSGRIPVPLIIIGVGLGVLTVIEIVEKTQKMVDDYTAVMNGSLGDGRQDLGDALIASGGDALTSIGGEMYSMGVGKTSMKDPKMCNMNNKLDDASDVFKDIGELITDLKEYLVGE